MTAQDREQVGYLISGTTGLRFECVYCATDLRCRVYRANIGIYSQQCASCGELIVVGLNKADGSGPLNLFETDLS